MNNSEKDKSTAESLLAWKLHFKNPNDEFHSAKGLLKILFILKFILFGSENLLQKQSVYRLPNN